MSKGKNPWGRRWPFQEAVYSSTLIYCNLTPGLVTFFNLNGTWGYPNLNKNNRTGVLQNTFFTKKNAWKLVWLLEICHLSTSFPALVFFIFIAARRDEPHCRPTSENIEIKDTEKIQGDVVLSSGLVTYLKNWGRGF